MRGAQRRFAEELFALLAESEYTTSAGRPNLAAFAEQLNGVRYESLRRAVRGGAAPSLALLEEAARVLRLPPEHFIEYRVAQLRRHLDVRTATWEELLDAVEALESRGGRRWLTRPRLEDDDRDVAEGPRFSPDVEEKVIALILESARDAA